MCVGRFRPLSHLDPRYRTMGLTKSVRDITLAFVPAINCTLLKCCVRPLHDNCSISCTRNNVWQHKEFVQTSARCLHLLPDRVLRHVAAITSVYNSLPLLTHHIVFLCMFPSSARTNSKRTTLPSLPSPWVFSVLGWLSITLICCPFITTACRVFRLRMAETACRYRV